MFDGSCSLSDAARALADGHPVIFPTDTVYGIGVAVAHTDGPARLYEVKRRRSDKPIAWLVGSESDLARYGRDVPSYAMEAARAYWPGALTLIVRAAADVPAAFCSEAGTIGLRMPSNETALALIESVGCPLATTSANIAGEPAVSRFEELSCELLDAVAAAVRDDGEKSGVASTVVDCTGLRPNVLREGAITQRDLDMLCL